MKRPFYPTNWKKEDPGFALIATISVLVLLALIAVGLLSLSSVSLRTSSGDQALSEARANARMALILAIAELQKATGPDTRITAPADSLAGGTTPEHVSQLTGVWRSWEGLNHDNNGKPISPDYGTKLSTFSGDSDTASRFLRWLVSSDNQNTATSPPSLNAGAVSLLDEGTLGSAADDSHLVKVDPSDLFDNEGNPLGAYAWWVQGNNSKVLIKPDTIEPSTEEEWSQRLASSPFSDSEHFGFVDGADLNKVNTYKSLDFIETTPTSTEAADRYHALTNFSRGLPTNAATGGWKRDLSLFSEKFDDNDNSSNREPWGTALEPSFNVYNLLIDDSHTAGQTVNNGGYLYPWLSTSSGTSTGHHPAMTWASLADFSSLYKKIEIGTTDDADAPPYPYYTITQYPGESFQSPDQYTISEPIFSKLQYVFSFTAIKSSNSTPQTANAPAVNKYHPAITIHPLTVYFNPYNVSIQTTIDYEDDHIIVAERATLSDKDRINSQVAGLAIPFDIEFTIPTTESGVSTSYNTNLASFFGGNNYRNNATNIRAQPNLDTMFEVNSKIHIQDELDNINFFWKPGESKVFGDAERQVNRLNKIIGNDEDINPVARVATGYNTQHAVVQLLDATHRNNRVLLNYPASANGNLSNNAEIKATLKRHSAFSPSTPHVLTCRFLRTNPATFTIQENIGEKVATQRHTTAVYDPATIDDTLPLPELTNVINIGPSTTFENTSPFLSYSFGLRHLADSVVKTKGYINNKQLMPLNVSRDNILDTQIHHSPFEWKVEALGGLSSFGHFSDAGHFTSSEDTSAYLGSSSRAFAGVNRWAITELPTQPLLSLCELQHFDPAFLNYHYPFVSHPLGNSHATPFMAPTAIEIGNGSEGLDQSYTFNQLMWDDWFVSSIAPETENYSITGTSLDTVLTNFLAGTGDSINSLRNKAYLPTTVYTVAEAQDIVSQAKADPDSWQNIASNITIEGMFNVNSTRVDAWAALLKGYKKNAPVELAIDPSSDGGTPTLGDVDDDIANITRMTLGPDSNADLNGNNNIIQTPQQWDDATIEQLAEYIVDEVKARGPFLSLSEFMNRRLEDANHPENGRSLALAGAVEAALMSLADDPDSPYSEITSTYNNPLSDISDPAGVAAYSPFPEAAEGHVLYGTAGWARQADVLRPIAPILSVRDDTFTIRAYGNARNQNNEVTAETWCEATVMRTANYIDRANSPTDSLTNGSLNEVNTEFGRRFKIVSFRWLSKNEV